MAIALWHDKIGRLATPHPVRPRRARRCARPPRPPQTSRMAWRGSAVCGAWRARPSPGRGTRARGLPPAGGPLAPARLTALVAQMRRLLEASPFPGAGSRKVWARRRQSGSHTSPRRGLRLRRAHQLLAPTRQGHPHGPQAHDGTRIPTQVATRWGTARTATCTRQEGQVAICSAVDHDSAACVGIHAAKQGTRCEAVEPLRPGVGTYCRACGQDIAQGLALRHDHGSH
jgi:putative transposase